MAALSLAPPSCVMITFFSSPSSSSSASSSSSSSPASSSSSPPSAKLCFRAYSSSRRAFLPSPDPRKNALSGGARFPSTRRRSHNLQVQAAKKTFPSFDSLLESSEVPLLVDFYATWCGPCQFMVPILNEVGKTLKNEIRIVKIDTEKYPTVASRYDVQALPTFILFQDGNPIDRVEGAIPASDLVARIRARLANSMSNK